MSHVIFPLSTFQSHSFDTGVLVSLSKAESDQLLREIAQYQQETKQQLVTLVNERYREFLAISDEVKLVAERVKGLVHLSGLLQASGPFGKFESTVNRFYDNSSKLNKELSSIEQTETDIQTLIPIVQTMIELSSVVEELQEESGDIENITFFKFSDYEIVSSELVRCGAMIEALDSVFAETGVGSMLLGETLPKLRNELGRLRGIVVNQLRVLFLKETTASRLLEIGSYLVRLVGKEQSFQQMVRDKFEPEFEASNKSTTITSTTFELYMKQISEKYMSNDSDLFHQLAVRIDSSLFVDVFLKFVLEEIAKQGGVNLFVPTPVTLTIFFQNYTIYQQFVNWVLSRAVKDDPTYAPPAWVQEYHQKWKISIYIRLQLKLVADSTATESGAVAKLNRLIAHSELLAQLRELPDGPDRVAQSMSSILEDIQQALTAPATATTTDLIKYYFEALDCAERMSSHVLNEIQPETFRTYSAAYLSQIVSFLVNQLTPILDSVRQISALYRVAARGPPAKHSVYVDLLGKPIGTFLDICNDTIRDTAKISCFIQTVGTAVSAKCIEQYLRTIDELLVKESAKTAMADSTDAKVLQNIKFQISFDLSKVLEVLETRLAVSQTDKARVGLRLASPSSPR